MYAYEIPYFTSLFYICIMRLQLFACLYKYAHVDWGTLCIDGLSQNLPQCAYAQSYCPQFYIRDGTHKDASFQLCLCEWWTWCVCNGLYIHQYFYSTCRILLLLLCLSFHLLLVGWWVPSYVTADYIQWLTRNYLKIQLWKLFIMFYFSVYATIYVLYTVQSSVNTEQQDDNCFCVDDGRSRTQSLYAWRLW